MYGLGIKKEKNKNVLQMYLFIDDYSWQKNNSLKPYLVSIK